MNIQVSVLIWTVICFLLLMLILHFLLFKPVLKVLDERKARIQKAQEKSETISALQQEHEQRREQQKIEYIEKRKDEAKAIANNIQSEGKKQIEATQRQRQQQAEEYRKRITQEYEDIINQVSPKMETAAAIFAKNLISHRI
ncbi:MAG: hypothetical protein PUB43_00490 [Oscillospiraceae bacterium]|nr:hypothetical protein [Oscillospiraceae bacterium]